MQGQLLVTLQGNKETRSHLFDRDVDSLLWVSLDESPSEKTAVACVRVLDGRPVVIPTHNMAAFVDGAGCTSCGPIALDWEKPVLLLLGDEGRTSTYALYVRPVPVGIGRYTKLDVREGDAIVMGRSRSCEIRYANPYVSAEHARIVRSDGMLIVEDLRSANGTMVNGSLLAPLQPRWLKPADVVQMLDLTLMVGDGFLSMNQPDGVQVAEKLRQRGLVGDGEVIGERMAKKESWEDPRFRFYPAPRLCKSVHGLALNVEAPPQKLGESTQPAILRVGSSLFMGLSSLCMLVPAVSRIWEGENPLSVMPMLAMGVSMVGMSVVLPLVGRSQDIKKTALEETRRMNAYTSYLDSIENRLREAADEQSLVLRSNRLGMGQILERAKSMSPLLMNRTSSHEDFLKLRVGTGDQEVCADISWPMPDLSTHDDPLFAKLDELRDHLPALNGVPLVLDLPRHPIVGVLGSRDEVWEFVRGLLVQVCALYSYEEVKVLLVVREDERQEWEFVTPLNHAYASCKSDGKRLVAVSQAGMADVDHFVEERLEGLMNAREPNGDESCVHHVIVCANKELHGSSHGIKRLVGLKNPQAFSLVFVGDGLQDLPRECDYLVCLGKGAEEVLLPMARDGMDGQPLALGDGHSACMFERNDVLGTLVPFDADILVTREEARSFSLWLSRLRLDGEGSVGAMPFSLGFLQLFGVGNTDQLNIGLRWKENHASRSLEAPIGIDAKGCVIRLDLHEKRHGPHGLIAGTTGSGKSEFIITYILSLCVSYAPDEVAFVLIDYKGGGLAGAFCNDELFLPHLAGVITNLDGAGIRRSLASIRSELRRRQKAFAMAKRATGELTMDIYLYLKLYRQGRIAEPMPHLFIVADEFAELRQQEPDFMAELVSAARIGRSLGIHLILATQRPTGVVDEQIWSNARFKVALKVADASDSREMIRTDDAAALTRPGSFFLLVGYGESFMEGQAAYAGFPYVERDHCVPQYDDAVDLVDREGNVLSSLRPEPLAIDCGKSELNAVLAHIQAYAQRVGKKAKRLWLDPLPTSVMLSELGERYAAADSGELACVVGLVDDPDRQRQFMYEVDLAMVGNAVIYGTPGSDPEGLLVAMLLSLAQDHDPDSLWMYGVDLGTNRLAALESLPHMGGMVLVDDDDRMHTLFRMIDEEVAKRRTVLAPYGGDLLEYNKSEGVTLPRVVIALTNLGALSELSPVLDDRLLVLTRDATRYGIHFVMTAASVEAVRMRMRANLGVSIPIQLGDKGDYATVLGRMPSYLPMTCARRGLLRIGEDIHEFQGVCASHDISQERLFAEGISARASSVGNGPPPIPTLPRHVTSKDMPAKECSHGLPVGYSKHGIAPTFLSLSDTPFVLVLGNDMGALVRYVKGAWESIGQAEQPPRARCVDVLHCMGDVRDQNVVGTVDELAGLVRDLSSQAMALDLLIVLNVAQTLEAIGTDVACELEALLEQVFTQAHTSVVIVSELWRTKSLYAAWYQAALAAECGIWVGNGFCEQTALRFARVLPAYREPAHAEDGFVVSHGSVELVRLVSPAVRDEGV